MITISENNISGLYPQPLLQRQAQEFRSISGYSKFLVFLDLAKLFVKNADLATGSFYRGEVKNFDPLVRDRCCQIHAMQIIEIFQDKEVGEEVKKLKNSLKKILEKINHARNKPLSLPHQTTFQDFINDHDISLVVSDKVSLLCAAHLLTFCTTPHQPRTIDYTQIKIKTSKFLDLEIIKEVVSLARTTFSESSTAFIQNKAAKFSQMELKDVRYFEIYDQKDNSLPTPLTATCMFYNMKTILEDMRQKHTFSSDQRI